MKYVDAMDELVAGKQIRRNSWPEGAYLKTQQMCGFELGWSIKMLYCPNQGPVEWGHQPEDIAAEDWTVVQ